MARREQEENRRRRGTGGLGWMNLGKTAMECCVSTPAAELNLLGKIEGLFPLLFFSPSSSTALKKKKKKKDFLNPERGTNMLSVLKRKSCG